LAGAAAYPPMPRSGGGGGPSEGRGRGRGRLNAAPEQSSRYSLKLQRYISRFDVKSGVLAGGRSSPAMTGKPIGPKQRFEACCFRNGSGRSAPPPPCFAWSPSPASRGRIWRAPQPILPCREAAGEGDRPKDGGGGKAVSTQSRSTVRDTASNCNDISAASTSRAVFSRVAGRARP